MGDEWEPQDSSKRNVDEKDEEMLVESESKEEEGEEKSEREEDRSGNTSRGRRKSHRWNCWQVTGGSGWLRRN